MKRTNNVKRAVLGIFLIVFVSASWAEREDTIIKETGHPYGGTCEKISSHDAILLASYVISGEQFRLNRGASVCKHNVELLGNENILKISTRRGDGIRSSWNDISEGNRRRFEFMFDRSIRINTGFRLEYSVRITQDNTFLHIPEHQYYWYWITQLHPGCNNCSPTMVVNVNRFKGISAFDYLIQDSSEFGAVKTNYTPEMLGTWVKVAIEFKPSHKNGFRRLWVNDQLVVNENNIQTIFGRSSNTFDLKFGIYQGTAKGDKNADYPSIRQDNQQSIQLKDFHFKRI